MENASVALQMEGITKTFPGVKALDNVNFEVRKGEVHVLLGENGAGKSTLMKVLSGVYKKDSGEILIDGEKVEIVGVRDAQKLGISIIHQELNMLLERTVAQNIYLGREPVKNKYLKNVDIDKMRRDSLELMKKLNLEFSPNTVVKKLSIAQQQMVEVVKALSIQTKILIMDEPTSSLTQREIDTLFSIIANLKAQGISIIYISHRMEEIFRVGDRVTVMRDGKYVGTVPVKETTMDDLVSMMVGHRVENLYSRTYNATGDVALRTEQLTGRRFRNVSIEVRRGEIVGLGGLVGAGRTELAKAIYGYDEIDGGKIVLSGKELPRHTPKDSVNAGLAFLPEDRKNEGLIIQLPVCQNIVQSSLNKLFPNGLLNRGKEIETAQKYRKELRIASPDVFCAVQSLSGGNQQKVVLGKWLCTGNDVFIFDEPTRGIDVGAKHEIYELMNDLAAKGAAILFISSDQMELIGISDRVYVMCEGEIVANLSREELTPEKLVSCSLGKGGAAS